ncbi:MAG: flavin reductase family protein [Acidobacteria bacterium]|nr:flavin reductase family protein [Acidobacteriota bacterium]
MAVSSEDFRAALTRFASGVTVVTSADSKGRPHGLTVSAFCSVSLEPPLVLICIEKLAGSHASLAESGRFTVNLLASNQAWISERFASLEPDKFRDVPMAAGVFGLPLIAGSLASLECEIRQAVDAGDHSVFIGEVMAASADGSDPLVYFLGDYRSLAQG